LSRICFALSGDSSNTLPSARSASPATSPALAQRIDRRIGDLREALAETIEQRPHLRDIAAIGVSSPIEPVASARFRRAP
jgi:hypothetical protein